MQNNMIYAKCNFFMLNYWKKNVKFSHNNAKLVALDAGLIFFVSCLVIYILAVLYYITLFQEINNLFHQFYPHAQTPVVPST